MIIDIIKQHVRDHKFLNAGVQKNKILPLRMGILPFPFQLFYCFMNVVTDIMS